MLEDASEAGVRRHRFLNVSTGECIRVDLSELADEHTLLALTSEGLLLLLHEPTLVVRLLNPLTRQLTDLPPVTDSLFGCSTCTDWANLGDGPAGLIAEFTLASDVADYVRFRAACQSWRRCSPDPRAGDLDGCFLPRQWIMLEEALGSRCRRFLNTSTGECIRMDLPELTEHTLLALTPEGLLLLLHEPTLAVRLLNPLSCQLTDLPPVTGY
jgi:hypothetical protein